MPSLKKRATVYFDLELHRALRLKTVETDQSLSELVNEAVSLFLDPVLTSKTTGTWNPITWQCV